MFSFERQAQLRTLKTEYNENDDRDLFEKSRERNERNDTKKSDSQRKRKETHKWLRKKELMGNAWALKGEEGRSKRRNASGSRTQTANRRYPNGGTRIPKVCIHRDKDDEKRDSGN